MPPSYRTIHRADARFSNNTIEIGKVSETRLQVPRRQSGVESFGRPVTPAISGVPAIRLLESAPRTARIGKRSSGVSRNALRPGASRAAAVNSSKIAARLSARAKRGTSVSELQMTPPPDVRPAARIASNSCSDTRRKPSSDRYGAMVYLPQPILQPQRHV